MEAKMRRMLDRAKLSIKLEDYARLSHRYLKLQEILIPVLEEKLKEKYEGLDKYVVGEIQKLPGVDNNALI